MNADPTQVKLAQELKHTSPLVGCRFDPTGRYVFAGAQDNTVQRWELATGKKTSVVGHKSWVRAIAYDPDGNSHVSGDLKGVVKQWHFVKRTMLRDLDASVLHNYDTTFCADHGGVRSMAFSPDGSLLACAGITDVSNAFAGVGKPL